MPCDQRQSAQEGELPQQSSLILVFLNFWHALPDMLLL